MNQEETNQNRPLAPAVTTDDVAYILETKNYTQVENFIENLAVREPDVYTDLLSDLLDFNILTIIQKHKLILGKFLADASRVAADPLDYARVVFTLAKNADLSLPAVQAEFVKEFGPNFHIFERYNIDNKSIRNWKDFARRAKEIKNGFRNHSMIIVKPFVEDIIEYYKSNKVNDLATIDKLYYNSSEIMGQIGVMIMDNPNAPQNALIKKQIIDFYHASNRLELDVKAIDDMYNFDQISEYINKERLIYAAKIHLIGKNLPLTDYAEAYSFLMHKVSDTEFSRYVDLEELLRRGVILPPANQPNK